MSRKRCFFGSPSIAVLAATGMKQPKANTQKDD